MQQCYKPKSNIIFSGSVRKNDEDDYLALRKWIGLEGITLAEYAINAYRELDKGSLESSRLKAIRWRR